MTKRRSFAREYKIEAVRLAKEHGYAQTARNLGINDNLLYRWRDRLERDGDQAFPGQGIPTHDDFAQLQRRYKRLQEENAILKKAVGIFSKNAN